MKRTALKRIPEKSFRASGSVFRVSGLKKALII